MGRDDAAQFGWSWTTLAGLGPCPLAEPVGRRPARASIPRIGEAARRARGRGGLRLTGGFRAVNQEQTSGRPECRRSSAFGRHPDGVLLYGWSSLALPQPPPRRSATGRAMRRSPRDLTLCRSGAAPCRAPARGLAPGSGRPRGRRVRGQSGKSAPPGSQADRGVRRPLGAEREERLLLVFAGLLDQFNLLREFVIEGVRDFVLRAKILRDAVVGTMRRCAALPPEARGGAAPGLRSSPRLDARRMDDAMEEAEFLCRRYGYLDRKLRELTAAIRAAL